MNSLMTTSWPCALALDSRLCAATVAVIPLCQRRSKSKSCDCTHIALRSLLCWCGRIYHCDASARCRKNRQFDGYSRWFYAAENDDGSANMMCSIWIMMEEPETSKGALLVSIVVQVCAESVYTSDAGHDCGLMDLFSCRTARILSIARGFTFSVSHQLLARSCSSSSLRSSSSATLSRSLIRAKAGKISRM